ncbi:MAG: class I SAM-dependent methyltransferase [Actinomycetota bacterium]|nr:class I SAM-dependent methyltransferase [Actinomycetota bacterium]
MTLDPVRPNRDDPPLLYSLHEFREIIFSCFDAAGATTVVEIGAEAGGFTGELATWTSERGGHLTSIDPAPSPAVRDFIAGVGDGADLVEDMSIPALGTLPPADAYLLDGDHNYHTVSHELELIDATTAGAGAFPLLILQDVSWPAGVRDQYYDPSTIPAEALHPYSHGGVVPWAVETGTGGFRGGSEFAFARSEGGPRNGVGTALKDFLAEHPAYEVLYVPAVFGLAVVYPSAAPWAGELAQRIQPFDDHPLLRRLEANRIWLYLKVIDLQDRLRTDVRRVEAQVVTGAATIARLGSELEVAGQQIRELGEERNALAAERDRLATELAACSPPARTVRWLSSSR